MRRETQQFLFSQISINNKSVLESILLTFFIILWILLTSILRH